MNPARFIGLSGSGRRTTVIAIVFIGCWILVPFWKIATLRAVNIQDDIFASDLINDRLPCRAFVGQSLRSGELPVWMPGIYTGFPSLAQVEIGTLYPPNILLFGLLPPYVAIAYAQLLPLFLVGLGAFLLARQYGLPLSSGLLTAGSLCLSGFFVSHIRHLNMIDAACWIPLLLLLTERMLRRQSHSVVPLLSLAWALQLLAGHPQISYYTGLVLLIYFIVRWRQIDREVEKPLPRWPIRCLRDPMLYRFGLATILGTLAAAAQILPSIELSQQTIREGGLTYEQATMYPAAPQNIWTFLVPYINGDPGQDSYNLTTVFWEQYGYLGLIPIVLALAAVVFQSGKNPLVGLFGTMVVVSYLMVLGKHTPLFPLAYEFIPGMKFFRFPTRFLVFVELGLALLAGIGLAFVRARIRRPRLAAGFVAVVLAATAADLWHHQMRQVPQASWSEWTSPIQTERFLAKQKLTAKGPWRYFTIGSKEFHIKTYHGAKGWAGDLAPYIRLREMLQPSFNLLYHLESVDGYVNLVPRHYEETWGSDKSYGWVHLPDMVKGNALFPDVTLVNALRAFNVKYVLSPYPLHSPHLRQVFHSVAGVSVYEVEDVLPRAFVVGEVIEVNSGRQARHVFESAEFDPAEQALVHEPGVRLPPEAGSSRNVRVTHQGNSRVTVQVSLERPGFLVLSEGYYSGWRATLDGEPVPIIRTNMMMRGLVVPAGKHEVVFSFQSRSVRAGLAISSLGIFAVLVMRKNRDTTR